MQVEARLVRRTQALSSPGIGGGGVRVQLGEDSDRLKSRSVKIKAEFNSWARLFSRKFIDRTRIGVLMMFFQRESWTELPSPFFFFFGFARSHPGIVWLWRWCSHSRNRTAFLKALPVMVLTPSVTTRTIPALF